MNIQLTYEGVRALTWIIGVPIIFYLLARIVARVRAIRALDTKLRAEEQARVDAALRGDTPINPYADMAALYGVTADEQKTTEVRMQPKTRR